MRSHCSRAYLDPAAQQLLSLGPMPRRALFLDRDGVINEDLGYVHRPEDTGWIPGVFDLCRDASAAGLLLVVVTNQAGIARGYYTESDFLEYTSWMHGEFALRGVPLLATFYCPHHPDAGLGPLRVACECRKPNPGMILDAAQEFGLAPRESVLVGNSESDMMAGRAAGIGLRVLLGTRSQAIYSGDASAVAHGMDEVRRILHSHYSAA